MDVPVPVRIAATAALYSIAGMAGLSVPFTSGNVSPLWPASGAALACLLFFGLRCWPGVILAAFLVNFFSHLPVSAALGLAVGNTAAALAGASLLLRIPGFRKSLCGLREMLGLVLLAAAISPLMSASLGIVVLFLSGTRPWAAAGPAWLMYYMGDMMGVLLVAPLLLSLTDLRLRYRPLLVEFCVMLVSVGVGSSLLFGDHLPFVSHHSVLVLLVFPFVLWAAIRFGIAGTAATNLVIATIAVLTTAQGVGPFAHDPPFVNSLLLQLFLATISVSGLFLSATITERQRTGAERQRMIATERSRAEELARKARSELQEVLDNSPVMIYMKDPEGRYTFVNRCWTHTLRTPSEDALGKTDFQLFPDEGARQFVTNDKKVVESGSAMEFEEQARLPDGVHTYQSIKVALRDDRDNFYALCGFSTDITERKLKEESLRQVYRALRVLSQCNSAVVHATEEHALLQEVCRIAVGPAGYQLAWVGYASDDERHTVRPVASAGPAEGFLDKVHVSWSDNEFGRGSVGRSIRECKSVAVHRIREQPEYAVWRDALAERNFESVLSVPLCEGSSTFGALAIYAQEPAAFNSAEIDLLAELGRNLAHGISALRARKDRATAMAALEEARLELEERVRQRTVELEQARDAAESADRLKSAFLAAMSHELRTPLNSIIGFTGIVAHEMAGPLNEEQKKQLAMVQNSARHLLALINDVLDISKIEAGQLEIQRAPFSIVNSIDNMVSTISPLAKKKDLPIYVEISAGVGEVFSDQRRIEQVLLNLLANAVKFTDQGKVLVRCNDEGEWLVIAVQDTGIGIPPEHHKSIFEPFRQLDTGVARKREGTGLGLSICRRLVERLGGVLLVESAPGLGSTFTLRLPLKLDGSSDQENSGN